MTDEQIAALVPDLERWEGSTTWMYRDTMGYVTVGIGNLLHDADDACALPFLVGGTLVPASAGQIQRDFIRVVSMAKGLPATMYRSADGVALPDAAVQDLAVRRLRDEFLPGLSRLFIGFDEYPAPAQSALVDICWNVGVRGLAQFGNMLAACRGRHWAAAANSCHVKTSRDDRNEWRRAKFMEAAQ